MLTFSLVAIIRGILMCFFFVGGLQIAKTTSEFVILLQFDLTMMKQY